MLYSELPFIPVIRRMPTFYAPQRIHLRMKHKD